MIKCELLAEHELLRLITFSIELDSKNMHFWNSIPIILTWSHIGSIWIHAFFHVGITLYSIPASSRLFFFFKYMASTFSFALAMLQHFYVKIYHTLSSLSRISLLNMFGLVFFKSSMRASISGVATFGFEPPIMPGRIDPVSWYRFKIFDTHPWDTRNWREITHGRIPAAAISTIFNRVWFGSGRPLMNTPPNWLTRPWPAL